MNNQFSDCCPFPPYSSEENLWRMEHFKLCIAKIGSDGPMFRAAGVQALEYMQPMKWALGGGVTVPDSLDDVAVGKYAKQIALYVRSRDLAGIFIDTPLDIPGSTVPMYGARLFADIAGAMPDRIVMPNFGDFITWHIPPSPAWSMIRRFARNAFIQVAVTTRRPEQFRERMSAIMAACEQGSVIVAGIDDRPESALSSKGPYRPDLAAAMALSFEHPNLYWYYQSDADARGRHARDYCWNPTYDVVLP